MATATTIVYTVVCVDTAEYNRLLADIAAKGYASVNNPLTLTCVITISSVALDI